MSKGKPSEADRPSQKPKKEPGDGCLTLIVLFVGVLLIVTSCFRNELLPIDKGLAEQDPIFNYFFN